MEDAVLLEIINSKFEGLRDRVDSQFDGVNRRLDEIHTSQKDGDKLFAAHVDATRPHPNVESSNGVKEAQAAENWIKKNWKLAAMIAGLSTTAAGGGTYAFTGCGGKEIHVHDAAPAAIPAPTPASSP